jgi:cytoskeletal protein RodZ
MEIINSTGPRPIGWLIPQRKSLSKALISKKTKRQVRSIVLFLLVLVLLFIVGVLKMIQISLQVAYQEFESALQDSEPMEISNSQKNEDTEVPAPIVVVRDTRIRSLRKEASHQGIRNASRMSKAELLVVLQIPIGTKQ